MITFESRGDFKKTETFFDRMLKDNVISQALRKFGQEGVNALSNATPVGSGLTAASWDYEVINKGGSWSVVWTNSHIVDGTPLVILLQYGHGTGTGGYVQGRDFINPAIRPIFDRIADDVWKAVTSA